MAIYHLSARAISRGDGRSAVAAAAYRRGTRMENRQEEHVSDYSRKERVAHSEISLPEDSPEWVRELSSLPGNQASEEIWNTYEEFETRKNALLARETIIALPKELSLEQNIELVREFTKSQFSAHGVLTDWSIHEEDGNPHAHVMILPRHMVHGGFGPKSEPITNGDGEVLLRPNGQPMYKPTVGGRDDLRRWRESWAAIQNEHLARHGHSVRVDHRSYREQGVDLVPTRHVGPAGMGMWRRTQESDRYSEHQKVLVENGRRIMEAPESIIRKVASQRSVFTENDLIKEAGIYLNSVEDIEVFRQRVLSSPELVQLAGEVRHETKGWILSAARFTSQEMLSIETEMAGLASKMAATQSHTLTLNQGRAALAEFSFLGHEQQVAVEHVLLNKQLASVVGYAGSGKTTMVEAAKHAWEAAGYTVKGGALSGIAAQGLGEGAGIESRTLASWEYAWKRGRDGLSVKDVLVIDEAGMVGSRQMRDVLVRAHDAGAKVVLIGDAEQLQPIEAGAAFRAIAERSGAAVIGEIRRQNEEWMREASKAFATHDTVSGFAAYQERGHVLHERDAAAAKSQLVTDWIKGSEQKGSQIILAHRRLDVADLNLAVREERISSGVLSRGQLVEVAGGQREIAPGEQIIFQGNDRGLGVKNGTLGHVEKVGPASLDVRVGAAEGSGGGSGRLVHIDLKSYNQVDYGYAATIHKSQGVTVDRAFVYGSGSMDRHLTYVSMTRHREDVKFYSSPDEFKSPEMIGAKLSRGRLQSTTLDYLERRQAVPEQDRAAYLRRALERQVDRLKAVTARLAEIPARLKQRLGIEVEVHRPPSSEAQRNVSTAAPDQAAAAPGNEVEAAAPIVPAMKPDDMEKAKQALLSQEALERAVADHSTVKNAAAALRDNAKFVSSDFQRDLSRLSIYEVRDGRAQELVSQYRLTGTNKTMTEREIAHLQKQMGRSEENYRASVDRALLRSKIEVPSVSVSAQQFAEKLASFKEPAEAAKFIETTPNAKQMIGEFEKAQKAVRERFGVSDIAELRSSDSLELKIAGVKPERLQVAVKSFSDMHRTLAQTRRFTQSLSLGRGFSPGM